MCLKVQVYDHDISIEDFKGLLLPSKLKQSRRFNNTKNEKTDRSQTECTPALPKIQSVIKSDWQNPQYQKQDDVKLQEDVKIKDSRSVGLFKYESKNM